MLEAAKDGLEIVEGSVSRDHIHLCLRIAPKHADSKVMVYLKGNSALILSDHHQEWRNITGWDPTLWVRSYYVKHGGYK